MSVRKKILVTGGAGYIGSHTVVSLFESGYMPIIVDSFENSEKFIISNLEEIIGCNLQVHEGDCNDAEFLKGVFDLEQNIEGVIHFAAYKSVNESVIYPDKYYKNNVGSLEVLLDVMKEKSINNIVFSSSCTVYGLPDNLPVTEKSPFKKPETPYGHTKQICENLLSDNEDVLSVILRYFNPIGAHPSGKIGELPIGTPNNLVPFITQTAAGWQNKLLVFGNDYETRDGSCIRDFIHVMDLAHSHVKALEFLFNNKVSSVFNVGTGKGNSVLELVNSFEKVNNLKLNYEIAPRREGDIAEIYAETTKVNNDLDWKSIYTIDDALKDAWSWQKKLKKEKDE